MSQNKYERAFENTLFASRWLMAPFYVGLVGALVLLLIGFVQEIVHMLPMIVSLSESSLILWILTLIDMSLAANLLLMVIFAGYENFVSKIDTADHPDTPPWMGKIDFSGMKLKLVASIVAISAIHLLKVFMSVDDYGETKVFWMVVIHLAFVISGLLLALMDWIAAKTEAAGSH